MRTRLTMTVLQLGLVALAATCALMLFQSRLAARAEAVREAKRLAQVLQDGIETDVQVAGLSLRNIDSDLRLFEENHLAPHLRTTMLNNDALPAQAFGALIVLDEAGCVSFFSGPQPTVGRDFSNRAYFTSHRDHPEMGLTLDLVTASRISGDPIVVLSRRLNHADGSFAGVAAETIRLSLFKARFDAVELGPDDDVLLETTDAHAVFRRNFGARFFGLDTSTTPLHQALLASDTGVTDGASAADGVPRLWAQRKLDGIGLTVVVGLSLDGIYAVWREQALIIGPAVACLLVVATGLGFGLRRELARREGAEAALRASEAEFRLLSDAASDMISRVDAFGQRRYVSPSASKLLGIPAGSLLGTAAADCIVPEDRPMVAADVAKLLAGGVSSIGGQFRVRRADGVERWIDAVASKVVDPVTGASDGYIAAWRDVTDSKLAEVRLVESETRYRLLTESASDVITCLDLNLRRTYVSPSSLAVLGYQPSELLHMTASRTIHPDDAAHILGRFGMIAEGLVERDVLTNRIRHKAGHYVWVEVKITLMRDPATRAPTSILCVLRDISERKAAADELLAANRDLERLSRHLSRARDAAERASEAKSRFLASVSHELRTPLNGILGYAELLQMEGGLITVQTARDDAMRTAGQHLLSMITGVLDLSEIETGRLHLNPERVALDDVIQDCLAVVRPLAQRKNLALSHRGPLAGPSPLTILADPQRLRQILLNLLGNAVKFTSTGSIAVSVSQASAAMLRIEVADTGPGIPARQRDRLFQEFNRLGGAGVQEVEGAGLGLALSHRLVVAMGGTIGHADNPSGGSIFWLELPAPEAMALPMQYATIPGIASEASPAMPGSIGPAEADPAGPSWRVLVVDDVAINRDIAAAFLTAAGHQPTCAESGEEAVSLATTQDFDMILMDVRMPGIDGREATRRIRAIAGPRGQVPVVALTAQAFANEMAECRQAGMDEHLAKPFTQPALLAAMGRVKAAAESGTRPASSAQGAAANTEFAGDVPLLDLAVFDQTTGYLPAENVASHVRSLVHRTEALLDGLADASIHPQSGLGFGHPLIAASHSLAGSAGMFGFERLSTVARQFEFSAESNPVDLPALAESLRRVATASIAAMRQRLAMLETTSQASKAEFASAGDAREPH